jgi:ankyrin repeat protein
VKKFEKRKLVNRLWQQNMKLKSRELKTEEKIEDAIREESDLCSAVLQGNLEVVKLLLDKNADPNVKGKNGLTPIYIAVSKEQSKERSKIATSLLRREADPNLGDKRGNTPLHFAFAKNDSAMIKLIFDESEKNNKKIDINVKNMFG